ncbi:hypothetical protein [Streptomyces aidingensis]|uniref:Uncharacterized protein n=1 Tax=Streptomyces aidingensis TaxID=910347 RepID=A0A1I1TAJ7_9ACTN|nr:hypothetical protein [Streptomyces aidingensis]SFD55619.1 hypothetical protein SAMN05421773_11917 [Streptomyces aidingensis]
MRTTDPIEFLNRHREIIFRWIGILAVLLVLFLILRHFAMRLGGWRAAWRRVKRECAVSAHAFAAPAKAWLRHRRSLRVLVRGLRAPATWRDAERALAAARQAAAGAGGVPYAALVDDVGVTVLLAGRRPRPPEEEPWWGDEERPDCWSVDRDALPPVVPVPDQTPPVLVALGEDGGCCVFLDVAAGPPLLNVEGDRRAATAVHQALAAQLDVRLPDGLVVVAQGVHRAFPGLEVRAAHRRAEELPARGGLVPWLVTAELPDPLPPGIAAPAAARAAGPRILLRGPGRGFLRTVLSDREGRLAVAGTPLLVAGNALSRAIARVLSDIPPVLPPGPGSVSTAGRDAARAFAEDDERPGAAAADGAARHEHADADAGADAWPGADRAAAAPPGPAPETETGSETEAEREIRAGRRTEAARELVEEDAEDEEVQAAEAAEAAGEAGAERGNDTARTAPAGRRREPEGSAPVRSAADH